MVVYMDLECGCCNVGLRHALVAEMDMVAHAGEDRFGSLSDRVAERTALPTALPCPPQPPAVFSVTARISTSRK